MRLPTPAKDGPLVVALRFASERHRVLLGVSAFLFAVDALTCWVSHTTLLLIAVFALLRALVRGFLRPGLLRALDSTRRGEEVEVDELMSGVDCVEHAIGVHVITDIVSALSLAAGGLPGFALVLASMRMGQPALFLPGLVLAVVGGLALYLYAYTGVRFAEHIVALERLGTMTALSRSWRLARGRRLRILYAVFVASTLELVGLLWGMGAFGIGMLLSVPFMRLAGDVALVNLFAKLENTDEARAEIRSTWSVKRAASARGASLLEYALLLVGVLLIAAGAYRALGAASGKTADNATTVLKARDGSGAGIASSLGLAASAATALSPVSTFLNDFAEGFVKGDFSDSKGIGKTAGQIVSGFIPIYGQIAAARDAGAAIRDIRNGKEGAWANLGMATIGFVPGVGKAASAGLKGAAEAAKVAKAADELAIVAKGTQAAEETAKAAKTAAALKAENDAAEAAALAAKKGDDAAKAEQFGEGSTSKAYRDGDIVKKVVKDEIAAEGGNAAKITNAEREFVAETTVDMTNELHEAMPGMVPKMSSPAPGVISQAFVEGKSFTGLKGAAEKNAKQQMKDAIKKANKEIGLEDGGFRDYENGFQASIDTNSSNFRFDPKGNITSWFDPVKVVAPRSRGVIPGIPPR